MWVLPKAAGGHPWPLWSTQSETTMFLLTRNNAGLIVDKPYRIILKTCVNWCSKACFTGFKENGKNEGYLVAVGKEEEIRKAWIFIQSNISTIMTNQVSKTEFIEYALGKFRSLAVDEQLQTLPPEAQARPVVQNKRVDVDMDGDEFDSRFFYESGDITVVERDLNDLAREDSFFATNQYASLNLANAHSTIPKRIEIPENEKPTAIFACSLWTAGSLPRLGRLFLTPNYVGFHSAQVLLLTAQVISLRFTDIVHLHFFIQAGFECIQMIVKRDPFKAGGSAGNVAKPGTNAPPNLHQSLAGFHTVAFATLSGGVQIFDEVNKLWKLSMKKFQASESDKKRVREGEKKDEYLVTFEEAMKTKASDAATNDPLTSAGLSRTGSSLIGASVSSSNTENAGKKGVVNMARKGLERLSDKVIKKFRLPEGEVLLTQARATISVYARRGSSFIKSSNDVANVGGIVYVTTHFICFMDEVMYRGSYLGAETGERSGKALALQKPGGPSGNIDEGGDNLNDEAQNTAVLLAEWDVAAAEDEDGGDLTSTNEAAAKLQKQQEAAKNAKKKVPAYSLATAEDAPSRLWCVIPLREVSRLKIGKPTSQVSTAYAEFGMTPHIVNLHLPHNMYALTFINRPHMYDCMAKVHARVQRQEARRNPLSCYSLDTCVKPAPLSPQNSSISSPISIQASPRAAPSAAETLSTSPSSPTFSFALLNAPSSPNSSSQDILEPPPRSIFFKHVTQHPLPSGDLKFPESILNDARQFASTYRARERLQEEKFLNYFHKYGQSAGLVLKGPELPILIRNGIPHSLRGHLWFTLSGAANRFITAPKGYYQSILDKHAGVASVSVEQIERDLHRSMPTHPFYAIRRDFTTKLDPSSGISEVEAAYRAQLPEYKPCQGNNIYHPLSPPENEPLGISRLRRVLVAYAWHNPVIAYCQSMNIVVAALLLYMSEEEAFYTLITLVEYLEEYWTREMMGAIVDMLVLKDVLKQKRPTLVAHLESLQLDYSIAALPWFMCLFIGYVPMQLSLRLMDCFFYNAGQGKATSTLFQAAMALFTIAEEPLMSCFDPVAVSNVFREVPYGVDCDKLISLVFSDDSLALRASIIDELRNFHRYNAIQNIEAQNMEEEFMTLVYGRKTNIIPPRQKPALSASSSDPAQASSDSSSPVAEKPKTPLPPPQTPVHFSLGDLKRFYFNFKDAVLSEQYQPSQSSQLEDATRIANSQSLLSSLNPAAFDKLFRQHLSWWPSSSDHLLPHLFVWMDVSETNHLSFVEYVQGMDVLCYGSNKTVAELIFDLTAKSTTLNNQVSAGLDKKNFGDAVKLVYTTMLYSKSDPTEIAKTEPEAPPTNAPAPKYVPRRKLNLDQVSATSDTLDDWLLLNTDEAFNEVVDAQTLSTLFSSYSEGGRISKDHFLICVINQLNLIPAVTMADLSL